MKKQKDKKLKKRILSLVTAVATALGLLVGSSFDSPAQLLGKADMPAPAIVQLVEPDTDSADDADDVQLPGEEKRRSVRVRLREALLGLPLSVRLVLCVPLWLLGWAGINAVSALWTGVVSPLGGTVLSAAATSAVMGSAALAAVKAAFPDVSVKKIVDKRAVITLVIGCLLYSLLSAMLDIFWPDGSWLCNLTEGVALLAVLLWVAVPILRREQRRKSKLPAAASETVQQ